jgi:hypothetical protein
MARFETDALYRIDQQRAVIFKKQNLLPLCFAYVATGFNPLHLGK